MINPDVSIATLVLDHSECAAVFARHRIDYCCKGERPLSDACATLGLKVDNVLAELELAIRRRHPETVKLDARTLSTKEVILRLIAPHHQYLHRTMPFLSTLVAKVARVHGDREPSLHLVAQQFNILVDTLRAHLAEEETVLFPALLGGRDQEVIPMLLEMRSEHEDVGRMLEALRRAAADYVAPAWACNSYRTLLNELAAMEADVFEHVHLENHVLLPRYVACA